MIMERGNKIYIQQNPDLPCLDLPGSSIYRASILIPENKPYINVNSTPIYRAPPFTGPNSSPPRGPVNRGFTVNENNLVGRV